MNFNLIDESGMTAADLETNRLALLKYLEPLRSWEFGQSQVTVGAGDGVPIYITKRNQHLTAAGYHTVEHGKPAIYIFPKADHFGNFTAGKPAKPFVPARKIGTFTLRARPAVPATPDTMRGGQLATICHEVAEVLGDPLIQTLANPDAQGRRLLREITDPVHKLYYKIVVNGVNCILPNTVLPNWYELGSAKPYDVMGWCSAPFQLAVVGGVTTGYAYFVTTVNGVTTYTKV